MSDSQPGGTSPDDYELGAQVGHLLRRANQRHRAIFAAEMPRRLPPTQFAALAALHEHGQLSQNRLGRITAMDSATIAGVVSRLADQSWVATEPSETDNRMVTVNLTGQGRQLIESLIEPAKRITERTLETIPEADREAVIRYLRLLAGDGAPGE